MGRGREGGGEGRRLRTQIGGASRESESEDADDDHGGIDYIHTTLTSRTSRLSNDF